MAGRPYVVAILPSEEEGIELRRRFYAVIDSLTGLQQRALGRALHINYDGIRTHYKTRKYFPGMEVALRVIEWDQNGRPMETRKAELSLFDI